MLRGLLAQKKEAIVARWLESTLATYAERASAFFQRDKDPFSNPVGHALRLGTEGVFENLREGINAEGVCQHLNEIIKIRAIQDFSPAQTVSFVFLLKRAVRVELGSSLSEPGMLAELEAFDADVDQVALFAFDIYTRCREKLHELRINEIKRSVGTLIGRLGEKAGETETNSTQVGDIVEIT